MKILLLGGTDLSLAIARGIVDAGLDLAGVVHLGRSVPISYNRQGVENYRYADIEQWCIAQAIANQQFKDNNQIEKFATSISADFLLVAGWYHLVPAKLRCLFPLGTAGLHASLLPKLRGGAPLPWAILSGAEKTGISMFGLSDDVDAGPLYGQAEVDIGGRTSVADLVQAIEELAVPLVIECLGAIESGQLNLSDQVGEPTYCLQRTPDDGRIDWAWSAEKIDRLVRAVCRPYPGAFGYFDGKKVTIWGAQVANPAIAVLGSHGQIANIPECPYPLVVTGLGCLAVQNAQIDGGDALPILRNSGHRRFSLDRNKAHSIKH